MKKYSIIITLLLALVAIPAFAAETSQSSAQSLKQQIEQLTKKLEQLKAKQKADSGKLTTDKILNSNGFVAGKRQVDEHSYNFISDLVFGDFDKDGIKEAVGIYTTCGGSCGMSIRAFKLVKGQVLSVELPDSLVAGAAQKIESLTIANGLIKLTENDFDGSRTNIYKVSLVNNSLEARKLNSSGKPIITSVSLNQALPNATGTAVTGHPAYIKGNNLGVCLSVNNCEISVVIGGKHVSVYPSNTLFGSEIRFIVPELGAGTYDLYLYYPATGAKSNTVPVNVSVGKKSTLLLY